MKLSETGEARVRGYLFVLRQSLRSVLSDSLVQDAVRELESHIRDVIERTEEEGDERAAIERVLAKLGEPHRVAQAYSSEMTIDEAITTRRFVPTLRAIWNLATTTVLGFTAALGLTIGYLLGPALLAVAVLKPIFPNNTGLIVVDGLPRAFGVISEVPPGTEVWGGYWIVPISIFLGLVVLIVTHRCATGFLVWWRTSRPSLLDRSHGWST